MTWFKVDDGFAFHPKAGVAGNAALGLWVRAGSWSAQQLTDGEVPRKYLRALGGRPRDAKQLVLAGLWETTTEGWRFHDWDVFQPSRKHVLSEREAARERMKRVRSQRSSGERSPEHSPNVRPTQRSTTPTRPDLRTSSGSSSTAEPSAQTLLGEWIDHCPEPPPSRVKGQVAKEIKTMLDEGIPYERVREGVAAWQRRGLHPSTLASIVHELATPKLSRGQESTDDMFDRAMQRAQAREQQQLEA